nr:hypothetical protein [Tanacetum cinerariifolium]
MQDDEVEPVELQEVVEVVTTSKLIPEVVTVASATIIAAAPQLTTAAAPTLTTAPSAARKRKEVVIRDPEETATPSTIIHTKAKSKNKGKGILVEEPKPLKKQPQIELDEAFARELEVELNNNIDWDERKPQTEAQAKKNMMIYIKNVVGFKMDYFKGMTYDDIRPIFEKKFNSNVAFLLKTREQMEEEDTRCSVPNLEESKKCSWSSKGQKLKAVRVMWCADYNIHYNTVDLAGREEISTYKVLSRTNAQQSLELMLLRTSRKTCQLFKTAGERLNAAKSN